MGIRTTIPGWQPIRLMGSVGCAGDAVVLVVVSCGLEVGRGLEHGMEGWGVRCEL